MALEADQVQRAQEAHLTDDEYWERIQKSNQDLPGLAQIVKKEDVLTARGKPRLTSEMVEEVAAHEAERLMSDLLAVRSEMKADGPLTDAQFDQAFYRSSDRLFRRAQALFEDKARTSDSPRMRRFFTQLAETIRADHKDLEALRGDPSEAEMQAAMDRILGRNRGLTDSLIQGEDEDA